MTQARIQRKIKKLSYFSPKQIFQTLVFHFFCISETFFKSESRQRSLTCTYFGFTHKKFTFGGASTQVLRKKNLRFFHPSRDFECQFLSFFVLQRFIFEFRLCPNKRKLFFALFGCTQKKITSCGRGPRMHFFFAIRICHFLT